MIYHHDMLMLALQALTLTRIEVQCMGASIHPSLTLGALKTQNLDK